MTEHISSKDPVRGAPWDTKAVTNSIVIQQLQGARYGWPLFQLSAWKLSPVLDGDELRLMLGETVVVITGIKLEKIVQVLEQGKGGVLTEQGERYASLTPPNELYVKTITLDDPFA